MPAVGDEGLNTHNSLHKSFLWRTESQHDLIKLKSESFCRFAEEQGQMGDASVPPAKLWAWVSVTRRMLQHDRAFAHADGPQPSPNTLWEGVTKPVHSKSCWINHTAVRDGGGRVWALKCRGARYERGVRGQSPSCRRTLHKEPHTPSTLRAGDVPAWQNKKNVPVRMVKVVCALETFYLGCGKIRMFTQVECYLNVKCNNV